MTTLFNARLELAKILNRVEQDVLTGTPTQTDAQAANISERDDHFNKGTLFYLSGDAANQSLLVTDFDAENKQFTHASIATAAASGDRIAATTNKFPLWLLTQAINQALQEIGDYEKISDSLTTVANQVEYSLPTGVYNVRKVEMATASSEPYYWQTIRNWQEIGGKLYFHESVMPTQSSLIYRLHYQTPHSEVTADSDTIQSIININRLIWTAAVEALQLKYRDDVKEQNAVLWNRALQEKARLAKKWPVPQTKVEPILANYMGGNVATRDPALNN